MRARVDAVAAVGLALACGALVAGNHGFDLGVVVVTGAFTVSLLSRARALSVVAVVATIAAFGVGAARGSALVNRHDHARDLALDALPHPSRCTGRGHVASSPVRSHGVLRFDVTTEGALTCDDGSAPALATVGLYAADDVITSDLAPQAHVARGDEVSFIAQIAPPQRFWNEATGDPRPGEARRGALASGGALSVDVRAKAHGVLAAIDAARTETRARIEATFPEDTAPMARALVLGEADLDAGDDDAFRSSGLSHLLAVSGMHLVLVVVTVIGALRALLVRIPMLAARGDVGRLVAALGIPFTWAYADFAGGSGSAVRAAWMLSAVLLARTLGLRSDGPRALGLSIFAMAAFDPLAIFDVSFVLSAGATGGLLALARPLTAWVEARVPARLDVVAKHLTRPIATTLAATLPCAPILAGFAPSLPLGGVLANLVAVPVGELAALPLCLLHGVLAPFPAAERGCALAGAGALALVRAIARGFASATLLAIPVPQPTVTQWAIMIVATAVVVALGSHPSATRTAALRRHAVVVATFALVASELLVRHRGSPTGVLRATFLDVGQGDSALVDLPDGSALLIDGGGLVGSATDTGSRVVAPAFRARRRGALAAVILSHPHPDHFLGLASGLASVRFDALWDTGQGEHEGAAGAYADLLALARKRGVPVLRPDTLCGSHTIGGALVQLLAPCPGPHDDRGANDNSFVLRITFGHRSFLFVGDAEGEEERELLERDAREPGLLRADVLKVGHHGSRTSSSPAFLAAVDPDVAVISCGVRNRFGHPNPVALAALAKTRAHVFRTDHDGSVVVTSDGDGLDVTPLARR